MQKYIRHAGDEDMNRREWVQWRACAVQMMDCVIPQETLYNGIINQYKLLNQLI
jgi:hypothetical protein